MKHNAAMTYKNLWSEETTWKRWGYMAEKISLVEMLDWCGPRREGLKGSSEHCNRPADSKETENFLITLAATLFTRINNFAL